MNIYKIFDKNIKSEIELNNIPSSDSTVEDYSIKTLNKSPIDKGFEVYHQIKFEGRPWASFLRNGKTLAMRFHKFADFTIDRDEEIIYTFLKPGATSNTITHLIADHVIPNILTLSDNMVFHSSTVKIGDLAVSFIAPSGSGKSTLAAYFALKNQRLISDDSILVKKGKDSYLAVPSYPGIRLWPSSVEMLFDNQHDLSDVSQYNEKKVVKCTNGLIKTESRPTALSAIYILNRAESTSVEEISQSESFSFLIKNLYRFDFEDRKKNEYDFRFLTDLINNLELYKLNYSHDEGALEKAYKLVIKNCLN